MELNEREAHCVARLIQGGVLEGSIFYGCAYCKYHDDCWPKESKHGGIFLYDIRKRLTKETGVDLSFISKGRFDIDSSFPHGTFLKNSNEKVKDFYRKTCRELIEICDE